MYKVLEFIDFDNFVVRVPSKSRPGKKHLVVRALGKDRCDCEGFKYRGYCRHFSELFRDPILKPLRNKVDELLGKKKIESTEVDVEGWKGKSGIEIYESGDEFIIYEYRKRKSDGVIVEDKNRVKKAKVLSLWRLLNDLRNIYRRNEFKAREIFEEIISVLDLKISVDAFNGGRNRAKVYFPLYYYPLKVLQEHYGAVEHLDKTVRLVKLMLPE